MTVKTFMTAGVAQKVAENGSFEQFIITSLNRHLSGDCGEVHEEDAALNNQNPLNAMSAYTAPDGIRIWIKQDFNFLTVLFPDEY